MNLYGFFKNGKGIFSKAANAVTEASILLIRTVTSTHEITNKGEDGVNKYITALDITPNGVDSIIREDGVVWIDAYNLKILKYIWTKRGATYETEITPHVLDPPHATQFRTDALVLTFDQFGNGISIVKTGVTGLTAAQPLINSETEILLTFIDVNPGTTQPDIVEERILYDEDESVLTPNTANVIGTAGGAYSGIKSIEVTNFTTGESFYIKDVLDFDPTIEEYLIMQIRSDSPWQNFGTIKLAFINNANNIISNEVTIDSDLINNAGNPFAFDSSDNTWQAIVIPISIFNPNSNVARGIVILKDDNRGTDTFKLDLIRLQKGIVTPGPIQKTKLSQFQNDTFFITLGDLPIIIMDGRPFLWFKGTGKVGSDLEVTDTVIGKTPAGSVLMADYLGGTRTDFTNDTVWDRWSGY